jgi:hypothetical protein
LELIEILKQLYKPVTGIVCFLLLFGFGFGAGPHTLSSTAELQPQPQVTGGFLSRFETTSIGRPTFFNCTFYKI